MSYFPFILAQTPENIESLKKLLMNPKGAMIGSILVMMILSWRSGQTGTSKKTSRHSTLGRSTGTIHYYAQEHPIRPEVQAMATVGMGQKRS